MKKERWKKVRGIRQFEYLMGGGGSGGGGTTSTSTTQNYSPEEAAKRAQVMDEARRIYETSGPMITNSPYPGAKVVPYSAETLQAQDYIKNVAVPNAVNSSNAINNAVQFGLSDVLYPGSNPALDATIDASVRPIYTAYAGAGGALSRNRDQGVQMNQLGGSRQAIADSLATKNFMNSVGDTAAKVATTGYNEGLNTFGRTLAFAPQAIESATAPATMLSNIGAQKENLQMEQEQYASDAAMWALNAPWAPLQNYASIVYGGASPSTNSTSQLPEQQRGGGDMTGQLLSTGLMMAAMYFM